MDQTIIIARNLEDHKYYKYYPTIEKNSQENPVHNINKYTPKHIVIEYSKFSMLHEILQTNPFNTTHFGWIDIGIDHSGVQGNLNVTPDHIEEAFIDIPDNIKILMLKNFSSNEIKTSDYFAYRRFEIAAGYFTGSLSNMEWLCKTFDNEMHKVLEENYAPTEEQIFPHIIDGNRDKFDFWHGNYYEYFTNHYICRRGIGMINKSIERSRILNDLVLGNSICEKVWKSYMNKTLNVFPEEMEKFLREYYILAYYHHGKEKAREIALLYKKLCSECETFKKYFESDKQFVNNNFKFVGVSV